MVQKSLEFSTQQLGQHLAQTLGQPLSEQELLNCLQQFDNHTFRLPLSYFESRYVGDIISPHPRESQDSAVPNG